MLPFARTQIRTNKRLTGESMKKKTLYRILVGSCLALLAFAGCNRGKTENGYGTVSRSLAGEQKTGEFSRYFFTQRESDRTIYKLEDFLAECNLKDTTSHGFILLPAGMADTKSGKKIISAIQKEAKQWQEKEPSFQGYHVIKKKYPINETDVTLNVYSSVNGMMSVLFGKNFFYVEDDGSTVSYTDIKAKTYELKTGREISLADLFYEDTNYVAWLEEYMWKTGQLHIEDGPEKTTIAANANFCLSNGALCLIPRQSSWDNPSYLEVTGADMMEYSALGTYRDESENAEEILCSGNISAESSEHLYYYERTVDTDIRPFVTADGRNELTEFVFSYPIPEEVKQALKASFDSVCYMNQDLYRTFCEEAGGLSFAVETRYEVSVRGNLYIVTPKQKIVKEKDTTAVELKEAAGDLTKSLLSDYSKGKPQWFDQKGNAVTVWNLFQDPKTAKSLLADFCVREQEKRKELSNSKEEWEKLLESAGFTPLSEKLEISFDTFSFRIPWKELISCLK